MTTDAGSIPSADGADLSGPRRGIRYCQSMPSDDRDVMDQLSEIRQSIDNIDAALIHMLAERFRCTQRVGVLKAEHGLPASDPGREQRQIARLKALAEESHLDPAFAEKWFNFVVAEVIHHHERIAAES